MAPDFAAKVNLIGIGAPSGIFVKDVAGLLRGKALVPEFAMVANAIGAAAGSINSQCVVRIQPCTAPGAPGKFIVTGGDLPQYFDYYADALKAARSLAEERACRRAREQGARGRLRTEVQVIEDHYDVAGDVYKRQAYMVMARITEPVVAPCRALLARLNMNTGMFDFSVLLSFFLVEIVARVLVRILLMIAVI